MDFRDDYCVSAFAVDEPAPSASTDGAGSSMKTKAEAVATRRALRADNRAKRASKADELKLKGNELFKRGDYITAADFYVKAIQVQGPKPVLLSNLAAAYFKLKQFEDVEWITTTALEFDPKHIKARFRRGLARAETNYFEAAAVDFQTILEHDPSCTDAQKELELMLTMEEGLDFIDEDDYPYLDASAWPSYSDSDTADCKHYGVRNGIPCRHYNHAGCTRGASCEYSHAPDDKSVRDELGKNVCTHFLLDRCKFGTNKCVYSHDRTYLPPSGWWNYPEQVEAAKELQHAFNKAGKRGFLNPMEDLVSAFPKGKNFTSRHKRLSVIDELGWRHRIMLMDQDLATRIKSTGGGSSTARSKAEPGEKFALLVSLEEDEMFNNIHQHFLAALRKKVKIVQVVSSQDAQRYLESPHLTAILLTDAALARPKHKALLSKLVNCAKNGGTVVAGGQFSNHVTGNDFGIFTKAFGLSWEYGSYHRTTFSLNTSSEIVKQNPSLVPSYSMKALHASEILPEHAIYRATEESRLQSLVFAPVKIEDKGEAPVVQARVGRGWFGFIGDVNGEDASTKTTLAMMGLLDKPLPESKKTEAMDGKGDMKANGDKKGKKKTQNGTGREKGTVKESSGFAREIQAGASAGVPIQDGAATPPPALIELPEPNARQSIVVVALADPETFQQVYVKQISALEEHVEVKISHTAAQLITQLSKPNLLGIYIVDTGILHRSNEHALVKIVQYAMMNGGTVVVGGFFPGEAQPIHFAALFSAFRLGWKAASRHKADITLMTEHPLGKKFYQNLPGDMEMDAVLVHSAKSELDDVLYAVPGRLGALEYPVLQVGVGRDEGERKKGSVAYIGEVENGSYRVVNENTTKILLGLFGLLPPNQKPPPPERQKFVLVLSWMFPFWKDKFEGTKAFLAEMKKKKVEVVHDLSNPRAVELMRSPDLVGIFVTDAGICWVENEWVLSKLVEYTDRGGTIVFGSTFPSTVKYAELHPFFHENWGLNWKFHGEEYQAMMNRNPKNELVKKLGVGNKIDEKLPRKFEQYKAIHLDGISQEMALYSPRDRPQIWSTASEVFMSAFVYVEVAATRGGHVGFMGSQDLESADVRKVLYAMLGLA